MGTSVKDREHWVGVALAVTLAVAGTRVVEVVGMGVVDDTGVLMPVGGGGDDVGTAVAVAVAVGVTGVGVTHIACSSRTVRV
jgi:hypothetical protein